ncbi:MAG: peptidoglycan-associated lipoprotein Pal [Magnetospirillum sp. WYHS-4]
MRKITALLAALVLAAACETASDTGATTGGAGAGAGAGAGSTAAKAPAENSVAYFQTQVGDRVFFDYDKFSLKADARATLEKQAAWLKKFPAVTLSVEGHCDERGTREYNLALGERRANAARDYLVSLGVSKDRVKTISYGKERPVAMGSNEAAWAQNRRGVSAITGGAPAN